MAVSAWKDILAELRADRGMLLGASEFKEMNGVEQSDALSAIESRIKMVETWIDHYRKKRDREQRGFGFGIRYRVRKIRSMTDEELSGESND